MLLGYIFGHIVDLRRFFSIIGQVNIGKKVNVLRKKNNEGNGTWTIGYGVN